MLLLWIIMDQLKWEKKCRENHCKPAVTLWERLTAYFLGILLPIGVGLAVFWFRNIN